MRQECFWIPDHQQNLDKKGKYRQSGKKEQITVIGCGNAIGQSIPPMVIFEEKYLNYEW